MSQRSTMLTPSTLLMQHYPQRTFDLVPMIMDYSIVYGGLLLQFAFVTTVSYNVCIPETQSICVYRIVRVHTLAVY